ncbi:maleylpyruvate isomerase family mycothiol-dependent enzyme [Actinomycetes bacterium KLBMP 9759]
MEYSGALVEQTDLLGELSRHADMAAPVPTTPGWSLRKLLTHVGREHRWAATIIRTRSQVAVDTRTVADGKPPEDVEGLVEWLSAGARHILDAVDEVGPDVPVWTFVGPRPAAWWIRRRLHEATVHRADAALAIGVPYDLAPELAADGLAEWLDLVAARGASPLDPGVTLHLHATDDGLGRAGEWSVRGTADGVEWEHGHAKGDAAVRGRAADLLLASLRRIDASDGRVTVFGDPAVWTSWLDRTPF